MYRKSKSIQWRNREIYAEFCAHLRNGTSYMDAYAACGNRYDLSEETYSAYHCRTSKKQKWLSLTNKKTILSLPLHRLSKYAQFRKAVHLLTLNP